MSSHDELIGRNLARLRQGMSQTDLANQMRGKGHKWTQPTVVAIEKGERPLRMSEAIDLAIVLGADIDDLVKYPAALDFYHQLSRVEDAGEQLLAWAKRYEAQARVLLEAADSYAVETGGSMAHELEDVVIRVDAPFWELPSARGELDRYVAYIEANPDLRRQAGNEPRRVDDA